MYINSIDMVWLLNVKLGAVQSTYYMVKSYRFKFPNFRIGPCGISAAYRAHFPPLIVRQRVRIIPCGFRSIWCGNSARSVHFRSISCYFRSISCDFRRSLCASAGSCAEIPHGQIRKLVSICSSNDKWRDFTAWVQWVDPVYSTNVITTDYQTTIKLIN